LNIGLLECDHVDERFRGIAGGYRDMFEKLLRPAAPDMNLSFFDACHGELPNAPEVCDGYVCTGSRFGAYEQLEWIENLKGFVRRLHAAKKPFVGICFGHQLLAEALGGRVARAPQGWGVGVHAIDVVRAEPWMQPPLKECRMQYMHGDQVLEMPPDSVLLARGEHCEVAMYRVGETHLGIEGHPEFPAAYNEALIRDRAGRIRPDRAEAGLATVSQPTDQPVLARWIIGFLQRH
jgi:GMP synthase-like glutamine amidotransferase